MNLPSAIVNLLAKFPDRCPWSRDLFPLFLHDIRAVSSAVDFLHSRRQSFLPFLLLTLHRLGLFHELKGKVMSFHHFLLLSEPVTILQAPYFLLPNVAGGENRGHIVMGSTMLASTATNTAHRSRTATISPWTSRTRPRFFQASCCRSLAGRRNGYMNRISATGDGTRSGSAGSCLPPRRRSS